MTPWARRISALSWAAVALVLLRAASGGGGIGGFVYVSDREPAVSYAIGGVLLGAVLVFALAFAATTLPILARGSVVLAVLTIGYAGWWLVLDGHPSGLALGGAAAVALILAWPVAQREFAAARRRGGAPPSSDTTGPNEL